MGGVAYIVDWGTNSTYSTASAGYAAASHIEQNDNSNPHVNYEWFNPISFSNSVALVTYPQICLSPVLQDHHETCTLKKNKPQQL